MSAFSDPFDYPGVQRLSVGYQVTVNGRSAYVLPTEDGRWGLFEGPRLVEVLLDPAKAQYDSPGAAINAFVTWVVVWQ